MEDAIAQAVNAGLDMSMIPLDATGFTTNLTKAVADGKVTQARIDEAVSRILTLKFRLGLFEHPFVDAGAANAAVENPAAHQLARKAAQESLVLLRNDGTLPLSRHHARRILVTGPASDSPANQLGGWSIAWQGAFNLPADIPTPEVTTIKEGVQQAAGRGTQVVWKQGAPVADTTNRVSPDGTTDPTLPQPPDPLNDPANPTVAAERADAVQAAKHADAVVVAVGESPYAETQGDDATPALPLAQAKLIDDLKATGTPVIVVVVAGRPLEMDHQLAEANASLMAFLPGTEGGGAIGDTLFGKASPSGRLPVSWPKDSSSFPLAYNEPGKPYDPRFAFGYGLSYTRFRLGDLRAPWHASPGQRISASVDVANVGRRPGTDIVLAFLVAGDGSRRLVAFDRVDLGRHRRGAPTWRSAHRRAPTGSSSETSAGPSGSAEAHPAPENCEVMRSSRPGSSTSRTSSPASMTVSALGTKPLPLRRTEMMSAPSGSSTSATLRPAAGAP